MGLKESDRSLEELAKRFNRRADYISHCLRELEQWGWLASRPHGSSFKNRWITMCAFIELENQNPSQNTNQILTIPYIDLSEKELINSQILEKQKICEQLDDQSMELENKLNLYLDFNNVHPQKQEKIRNHFKTSPIGRYRKEKVLNCVIAQSKKKLIGNQINYISAALFNEKQDLIKTLKVFQNKNVNVNLYSQL